MIEVGIITAPRARPTITQSLQSFRKAGFKQSVNVFAEPGSEVPVDDGVFFHRNVERRGNFKNYIACLTWLAMQERNDWLMVCEDDIAWAPDACSILEHDLSQFKHDGSAGAISLFFPIRMSKVLEKRYGTPLLQGWYGMNLGRSTWGAQCLVFHRRWAERLLNDKVLKAYVADPRWDKNVDALIADAMAARGLKIMYRVPCLVDHTFGEGNSSLGYKADRPELKTRYFQGGDVS